MTSFLTLVKSEQSHFRLQTPAESVKMKKKMKEEEGEKGKEERKAGKEEKERKKNK